MMQNQQGFTGGRLSGSSGSRTYWSTAHGIAPDLIGQFGGPFLKRPCKAELFAR